MTQPFVTGETGTTLTVGTFDGVHRAHRAVLEAVAATAAIASRQALVVTFDRHPLEVVRPEMAPLLLTTVPERRAAIAETGVTRARFLRFDAALAALSPEAFVQEILIGECGMRDLVLGDDHALGRGRSGDVEVLRTLGERLGFTVLVVPPVEVDGVRVSSTRIRSAIEAGDLGTAARLLGRPYAVEGRVEAGAQRGRRLGIPTINLGSFDSRKLLPPDGVYAVRAEWRGGQAEGMMNQGPKPTFDDGRRTLEAHLFGLEADLYGEWVRLEWVERLRDVRRFSSAEELTRQLADDRQQALAALARTAR